MGVWRGGADLFAVQRDAEEDDALQALGNERREELLEPVEAPARLPRQGLDDDVRLGVVGDEDRVHEHRLGELPPALPLAG